MDAAAFQAGREFSSKRDAEKERQRTEANKAKSLRAYLGEVDPDNKNRFSTMSLAELEGTGQAFAVKTALAKQRTEEMKATREDQSAKSLAALIGQTGGTTTTRMPNTTAPMFPDTVAQTRQPVTAARVRELLPSYPEAANSGNLSDLLRILQTADTTEEAGGPPQILPGPFANTRIVTDARGRSTPQVVREEKAPEGYLDLPDEKDPLYGPRIRIPLSQARKEYPHLLKRLDSGGKETPSEYKSAEDVKAAVKAGKIKRDAAVDILRKQFGYQ